MCLKKHLLYIAPVLAASVALVASAGFAAESKEKGPAGVKVELPTPAMPEPNAWDFYVRAGTAESASDDGAIDYALQSEGPVTVKVNGAVTKRPITPADKAGYLQRRGEALRILKEGLRYEARHPIMRGAWSPTEVPYSRLRELGRMLLVMSRLQGEEGDWARAAETALDLTQLGTDMTRGAPIIGLLSGRGVQGMGRRPLENAIGHLDAEQARAAARRLESIMARGATFAEVLEEEKWFGVSAMLESMESPDWKKMRAARASAQVEPKSLGLKSRKDLEALRAFSDQQILNNYIRYTDALIANARRPYHVAKTAPTVPGDPLNKAWISPQLYARVQATAEISRAQNALLMTTLALRAFSVENGHYPGTLDELVPSQISAVPVDPFSGKPLRYQKEGASYLLYSIGPDGVDNSGRPVSASGKPPRPVVKYDSKGDIVSELPAKSTNG